VDLEQRGEGTHRVVALGTPRSAGTRNQRRSLSAGLGETGLWGRAARTAGPQAAPPLGAGCSPGNVFELV